MVVRAISAGVGLEAACGRVVLPTFVVSDSIDVGYSVPWFRAPNEVYATNPFDYFDGAQAIWVHALTRIGVTMNSRIPIHTCQLATQSWRH
jgi:hypothetical protein